MFICQLHAPFEFIVFLCAEEETSGDTRQYAQLQVLYKARGRKLEELTSEYEILKQETAREIRILKHQVSSAKGRVCIKVCPCISLK